MTTSTQPFDHTRYDWHVSTEDPTCHRRETKGGEIFEDIWHQHYHGQQILFLGAGLTITANIEIDAGQLLDRARDAWVALRFSVPTIAARTEYNDEGTAHITYCVASQSIAREWARRTVHIHDFDDTLDELRYNLSQEAVPDLNGDQTFIHIVPRSNKSFGLLLRTSHVAFDGSGCKILLAMYLKNLAACLADVTFLAKQAFDWGQEYTNLLPPTTRVLGPGEKLSGTRYQSTMNNIMADVPKVECRRYGFKLRTAGPGPTRRANYTFSRADTRIILVKLRSLGYTVNHVAHAALMLICAEDNPPSSTTPVDMSFSIYGLVDCRERLNERYSGPSGYPGYCLGFSPIAVPVRDVMASSPLGPREQLINASALVKDEYMKQKSYPCLLATEAELTERMLAPMKSGAPPPAPVMGFWFAADGVVEKYLPSAFDDVEGHPTIKVESFFLSLNQTEPGPFFRAYSYSDQLSLNADYNVNAMPTAVVEEFITKWAKYLNFFTY